MMHNRTYDWVLFIVQFISFIFKQLIDPTDWITIYKWTHLQNIEKI